jgi:hypothetical protein
MSLENLKVFIDSSCNAGDITIDDYEFLKSKAKEYDVNLSDLVFLINSKIKALVNENKWHNNNIKSVNDLLTFKGTEDFSSINIKMLEEKATEYFKNSEFAEAEKILTELVAINPDNQAYKTNLNICAQKAIYQKKSFPEPIQPVKAEEIKSQIQQPKPPKSKAFIYWLVIGTLLIIMSSMPISKADRIQNSWQYEASESIFENTNIEIRRAEKDEVQNLQSAGVTMVGIGIILNIIGLVKLIRRK